jgi:hypothetical protein
MPLVYWREELLPVLKECCGPAAERVLDSALRQSGARDARMSPAALLRVIRRLEAELGADRQADRWAHRLRFCASGELRPSTEKLPNCLAAAHARIAMRIGPAADSLVRRTRESMDPRQPVDTVGGFLEFLERLRETLPAEIDDDLLLAEIKQTVFAGRNPSPATDRSSGSSTDRHGGYRHGR